MSRAYNVAAERWFAAAALVPDASGHPFCTLSSQAAEHIVYDIVLTETGHLTVSDSTDLLRTISAAVRDESHQSGSEDLHVFNVSSVLKKMACMAINEKELMRIDRDTWEKKERLSREAAAAPIPDPAKRIRNLWKKKPSGDPPVPPPPPRSLPESAPVRRSEYDKLLAKNRDVSKNLTLHGTTGATGQRNRRTC